MCKLFYCAGSRGVYVKNTFFFVTDRERRYKYLYLSCIIMTSVAFFTVMLNVIMMSVTFFIVMLNVIMLSAAFFIVMLNVVMLSVTLFTVMLNVVMLNVVAPRARVKLLLSVIEKLLRWS